MQTADIENRAVIKSFRTTPSLASNIKKLAGNKVTESDIINIALEEYLRTHDKKGPIFTDYGEKDLAIFEYHKNSAISYLNNINHLKSFKINTPKQVAEFYKGLLPANKEAAYFLYLDSKNHVLKSELVGIGNEEGVGYNASISIKTAVELDPCQVIQIHNHIDDTVEPSPGDIFNTYNLYNIYRKNNIVFADALILDNKGNYFSFQDHKYFDRFEKDFNHEQKQLKTKWGYK